MGFSVFEELNPEPVSSLVERNEAFLHRFVKWMAQHEQYPEYVQLWHYANVEAFLDYLATYAKTPLEQVNEFDVRWFLYHYYIRRDMDEMDEEATHILLQSLALFYRFLQEEAAWVLPNWLLNVLSDQSFFEKRLLDYRKLSALPEEEAERGYAAWNKELLDDLDARLLLIPNEIGEGLSWMQPSGWREAALYEEALRMWLKLRSELLTRNVDEHSLQESLIGAYQAWLRTPQDRLDHQTPVEVILAEREESSALERRDDSEESDDVE